MAEKVFTFNLNLLAIYGQEIRSNRKAKMVCRIMTLINVILNILTLTILMTSVIYKPLHLPNGCAAASTIGGIVAYLSLKRHGSQVIKSIDKLLLVVDKQVKRKMANVDRLVCTIWILACFSMIGISLFWTITDQGHEWSRLMVTYDADDKYRTMLEVTMILSLYFKILGMTLPGFLYANMFKVVKAHAETIYGYTVLAKGVSSNHRRHLFSIIRKLYQQHIATKQMLNEKIGIVALVIYFAPCRVVHRRIILRGH